MRRRQPTPSPRAAKLPDKLRQFDPANWPVPPPSQYDLEGDASAVTNNPHTITPGYTVALMQYARARRAWRDAQRDWCRQHGLTNDRGQIDWRRFGPLLRGGS